MKAICTYNRCIQSRMELVCQIVGEIIDYLQKNIENLDDCTLFEIRVVLNEVVSNAIKHGNKNDLDKNVKISAGIIADGYCYFVVEDEGEGFTKYNNQFCCTGIVDSDDLCNIKESGRGILIVNSLCDKVKFNSKGNKVVILKKVFT